MKNLLFALAIAMPFTLFSQSDFKLTTGPVIDEGNKWPTSYFGEIDGKYYFSGNKLNKKDYSIIALNNDLSLERIKEIDPDYKFITYGFNGTGFYGFHYTGIENGNLVFLRPEFDSKATSGIETYFKETIEASSLNEKGESVKISEPMNVLRSGMFGSKDVGHILTSQSYSRSKRVFSMSLESFSKEKVEYQVLVLDDKFNPLSTHTINPDLKAGDFTREALAVGDDGTAYLLAAKMLDGSKLTEYILYQFSPDGENKNQITFNPGSFIFSAPILKVHTDGSVILTGFTSTTNNYDIDGVAYMKYEPEGLTRKVSEYYDLPVGFENLSKAIKNGKLDKFGNAKGVISENGSVTIAVEYAQSLNTSGLETGDLFALTIDLSGKIIANGVLLKEQTGSNRYIEYQSYNLYSRNNEVFILYNDHIKNADVPTTEKASRAYMTGFNAMFKVDLSENGFDRKLLYHSKKDRLSTAMNKIYETKSGDLLFCEEGKDGFRIRKLEL